jgi:hypothetical protein
MDEHTSGGRNGIEHVGVRDFLVRIGPTK